MASGARVENRPAVDGVGIGSYCLEQRCGCEGILAGGDQAVKVVEKITSSLSLIVLQLLVPDRQKGGGYAAAGC